MSPDRQRQRSPARLVGSPRVPGLVQLHQAVPFVERHHAIIEELSARAPRFVPGRVLAERTGTSVRTIERDMARLQDAGLPIDAKRGPAGGFRLSAPAPTTRLVLTAGEVAAMVAALVAVGPYTSATAQSVLAKLLATFAPGATEPESG